mmetsp:Transcript_7379/g.19210  ORF Transcript_7379/g.19210 Transcript_7379/m.19210 type:complete len:266 (-) Transcript_7379:109-906(-)
MKGACGPPTARTSSRFVVAQRAGGVVQQSGSCHDAAVLTRLLSVSASCSSPIDIRRAGRCEIAPAPGGLDACCCPTPRAGAGSAPCRASTSEPSSERMWHCSAWLSISRPSSDTSRGAPASFGSSVSTRRRSARICEADGGCEKAQLRTRPRLGGNTRTATPGLSRLGNTRGIARATSSEGGPTGGCRTMGTAGRAEPQSPSGVGVPPALAQSRTLGSVRAALPSIARMSSLCIASCSSDSVSRKTASSSDFDSLAAMNERSVTQ